MTTAKEALLARKADFAYLWQDEQLADVTIKIKIRPPCGRAQAAKAKAPAVVAPAAATDKGGGGIDKGVVATMRVHGAVLAQRSRYVDRALRGAGASMLEGQTKTLTVELQDEQEAEDYKRLIKLSYMESYVDEDGHALSKDELVRLLVLANGFEMLLCVEECAEALRPFDSYDEAMAFFQTVPDSLLQAPALKATTQAAGDALAAALGPLTVLWTPGEVYDADSWEKNYTMDERVKALPLLAIEAVLRSEELMLPSENYAFTLALWWVLHQPGGKAGRQPLFNRLLQSLRYARMSAPFLTAIAHTSWVKDSGLLPSIMARGFWRRDLDAPWKLPASRVDDDSTESYILGFTALFTKAAIQALEPDGDELEMPLGVLHGFPCYLILYLDEDRELNLRLRSDFLTEDDDAFDTSSETSWAGQDRDEPRGFEYTVVEGTFAGVMLDAQPLDVNTEDGDGMLFVAPDALAYDARGNARLDLTVKIQQHKHC